MGRAVAEKLITASLVDGEMTRGRRIGIRISQTLTHDVTGVMAYLAFEAIGLDVVLEALKLYRQRKRFKADMLVHFARICRVEKVMRPYLEATL